MQFTSLNKTINLLLLGVVAICLAAWETGWLSDALTSLNSLKLTPFQQIGQLGAPGAALAALLLTSLALVAGMVVDRFAERWILSLIANASERGKPGVLFGVTGSRNGLKSYQILRDALLKALRDSQWARTHPFKESDCIYRSTVEAIVLNSGTKDAVEWTLQHYAAARLASGLLLLSICGEVGLYWAPLRNGHPIALAGAITIYGLLICAVDQYLYSYESMVREALAVLQPFKKAEAIDLDSDLEKRLA